MLIIGEGNYSHIKNLIFRICLLVIIILVLIYFPLQELFSAKWIGYAFYLLPLLSAFRIKEAIEDFRSRDLFSFNKTSGNIIYNGYAIGKLEQVDHIALNYTSDNDSGFLGQLMLLQYDNGPSQLLEQRGFSPSRKQLIAIGREMAKFLSTEFVDNHPWEGKEVKWGKAQVNEQDLKDINPDFYNTNS